MFSLIAGADISNVNLQDVDIVGKDYVGGLVGRSIIISSIDNVTVNSEVQVRKFIGGLFGEGFAYITNSDFPPFLWTHS